MQEHKAKQVGGFSQKYNCTRLIWYEFHQYINNAVYREKQLKAWQRQWKINLINRDNPRWQDLARDWDNDLSLDPEPSSG